MNHLGMEREFSVPQGQEKALVIQSGDVYIPGTPKKLVDTQMEAAENWEDLLGIYSRVLQAEVTTSTSDGQPLKFNRNAHIGLHTIQDAAAPIETCNRLPQTGLWGLNHREYSTRVDINQNATGNVVPPRKVHSLAELMGMRNAPRANRDTRTTCVMDKPTDFQVESNCKTCKPEPQPNHILHANQQLAAYNLQQIPHSRLSLPYKPSYNLNLPPTSEEAGESSSAARPFQLSPVTPEQQKQLKNNQITQVPLVLIDEISTQEYDKQDNVVLHQPAGIVEREHNDILHCTLGTSSAAISTTPKEKQNSDGRNNEETDLNKTPPQKTPQRRKHRPKVAVEGKPNRTPKPAATKNNSPNGVVEEKPKRAPKTAATKNNSPDGNPTTKRKYVRKKAIKPSTNQPGDAANAVEVSHLDSEAKSCKRALHFDLENGVQKKSKGKEFDYQTKNNEGSKVSFNLNLESHNAERFTELNSQPTPAMKKVHGNLCGKEKQTESLRNFIHSTVPLPISKDHALNVIARSLNARNTNINQSDDQSKHIQVHHRISGSLAQLVIQANSTKQNLARTHLQEDLIDVNETQGSKGEYSKIKLTQPLMVSQIWSRGVSTTGHYNRETSKLWQADSESSQTKKVENKINGTSPNMPSGNKTVEGCSEQIESTAYNHAQSYRLHLSGGLTYSATEGKSNSINPESETNKVTHYWYTNSNLGYKSQEQVNLYAEQMAQAASHHLAKVQTTSSLTAVAGCHLVSASRRDTKFIQGNETVNSPDCVSIERQTAGQISSNKLSSMDKVLQQETKNLQGHRQYSKVTGMQEDKIHQFSVDDITDHIKDLCINNNGKKDAGEECSALVPYRGDGAVVPYEAFDPIKKRRTRPKVDLDPETNRLWNLLTGKEGSESAETVDNDKQKWWEEERKIFHGRVDSFIARMHLVQGDRRFSKWKGSVVDSVIGVFLTQNVSDHLSSSAFMSLAAKFPMKSTTIMETYCKTRGNPSTEHEVLVIHPDEPTYDHRMIKEPAYDNSSATSSELSEHGTENVLSGRAFPINKHTRRTGAGMISSQSSSESTIFQASEDIRSSSGSNSEAEDQITGINFRKNGGPVNFFEQAESISVSQQYLFPEMGSSIPGKRPKSENLAYRQIPGLYSTSSIPFTTNMLHYKSPVPPSTSSWQRIPMGLEKWEADVPAFLGKESPSSLVSTDLGITNGTGTEHAHDKAGQSAESSLTAKKTGRSKFQPSTANHEILNKNLEQQTGLPAGYQSINGENFINYRQGGMQETFQQESTSLTDPRSSAEAFSKQSSDNRNRSDNIPHEPPEMKKAHSSSIPFRKTNRPLNARKRKAEKEKAGLYDWDTLRKQVQSEAETRGKSRDKMDSLDFEALRNADVREISETIKERGMNNMLAERIKDFLNRLVRDHGGIDLEWLRDVQPDKAKDYLLSIRGLGLKSVECVRLLTLHHLAFPVDTNVGRIAVRLGWVPLQPLPESLQLHLLELYPVLETIQKYLWPRLCMLDQETLYELHYQMITFGKVFCTKREPNCNACPMRAECRHFASAFASARHSLPGPEERHMVSSAASENSSRTSGIIIKPMPLPRAEDDLGRGIGSIRNCEPIIEEPTTPNSPAEVSERDIEDAFYEDPNEIPVININIQEFTTNLQSIMQEKMEMQSGDISKALVALSPEVASIPVSKLKHASRLRTEHQVYELPDSHPLLKGLDRREPDDPSPYLLAIWTPGETADSVQPPESQCSSVEGGLCNKKTCFSCNSTREAQAQTVRGTILIPCRTAMRGSFPLNGTYFQVNEVFADHETSMSPINVPRSLIWNLPRRTVFFGTSASTIFKGLSTEDIKYCFWKGFVCVRGFDQKTRAPRPLMARLHLPTSKIVKTK